MGRKDHVAEVLNEKDLTYHYLGMAGMELSSS